METGLVFQMLRHTDKGAEGSVVFPGEMLTGNQRGSRLRDAEGKQRPLRLLALKGELAQISGNISLTQHSYD